MLAGRGSLTARTRKPPTHQRVSKLVPALLQSYTGEKKKKSHLKESVLTTSAKGKTPHNILHLTAFLQHKLYGGKALLSSSTTSLSICPCSVHTLTAHRNPNTRHHLPGGRRSGDGSATNPYSQSHKTRLFHRNKTSCTSLAAPFPAVFACLSHGSTPLCHRLHGFILVLSKRRELGRHLA